MYKKVIVGASCLIGFAAHADDTERVVHYDYGMRLDIAHVVSQSTSNEYLDVVPVVLIYLDSSGERHAIEYEVVGSWKSG